MSSGAGSAGGWSAAAGGGGFAFLLLVSTTLSTTTLGGRLSGRLMSARLTVRGAVTFGAASGPAIDTFPVDGHVIWGATQRITQNLLDVLSTLQ